MSKVQEKPGTNSQGFLYICVCVYILYAYIYICISSDMGCDFILLNMNIQFSHQHLLKKSCHLPLYILVTFEKNQLITNT